MGGTEAGAAVGNQSELRLAEGRGVPPSTGQSLEESRHELIRLDIRDFPERCDHRPSAGELKDLSEPGDTLACTDLTQGRLAGGEDDQVSPAEVEPGDLEPRDQPVVNLTAGNARARL